MPSKIRPKSADNVPHPNLSDLHEFWRRRCGDRDLPARADFQAEEFKPWMGHLVLLDVVGSEPRFRVRLSGVQVVAYEGREFTGRYLDEAVPRHAHQIVLPPFEICVRERCPVYDVFKPPYEGSTVRTLHRLLLPCASNGCTVDLILEGVYVENWRGGDPRSIYDYGQT